MAEQIVNLAALKCSMGMAPGTLMIDPSKKVMCGNQPAANIMDYVPMKNIMPFGMCQSLANPTVAAATAAALGVLTPMPCIPNTTAPWTPGAAKTKLAFMPTLDKDSKCMCMWAGVIEITSPGQGQTKVG